jgi:hypothetical protein
MHWYCYQIRILVHICYHHNLDFHPYGEETSILSEYHFYISNDRNHDSEVVQDCLKIHWQHMVDQRHAPKWHFVWLDGYAMQFKSTKPWYFVSRYPSMTNGCKMVWFFYWEWSWEGST